LCAQCFASVSGLSILDCPFGFLWTFIHFNKSVISDHLLSFLFWLLYCLSLDLWILITLFGIFKLSYVTLFQYYWKVKEGDVWLYIIILVTYNNCKYKQMVLLITTIQPIQNQ
jgi:uncharacterized membrane protein